MQQDRARRTLPVRFRPRLRPSYKTQVLTDAMPLPGPAILSNLAPSSHASYAGIERAARKFDVDVIVIPTEGGTVWHLTDLLGRSMGSIRENASHQFSIDPDGHAMADIRRGPHASLDAALAEIERHTRGICRRSTGEVQP